MNAKSLNRKIGKRRRDLLGGKRRAEALYFNAADLRTTHDLCRHSDDERKYASSEEAKADKTPPVVCDQCKKQKLRVAIIVGGGIDQVKASPLEKLGIELVTNGLLK